MSVNIPDIQCDKCSLQLLYVMTDKSVKCGTPTCYYNPADAACKGSTDPAAATCAGAPNDQVCVVEGECFSNCEYASLDLCLSCCMSFYLFINFCYWITLLCCFSKCTFFRVYCETQTIPALT